jgi:Protein of unknown function (DUF541)
MKSLILLIAGAAMAFAQTDDNTLTVTATQTVNVQPDQMVLAVTVEVESTLGLDDVVGLVKDAGITADELANATTTYPYSIIGQVPAFTLSLTDWTFSVSVPLTKLKDVLTSLATIEQTLIKHFPSRTLFFSGSSRVSAALQAQQGCTPDSLVPVARAKAQQLAAVAGLNLGPLKGVSYNIGSVAVPTAAYAFTGIYDPTQGGIVSIPPVRLIQFVAPQPTPTVNCTLAAQFQLIR